MGILLKKMMKEKIEWQDEAEDDEEYGEDEDEDDEAEGDDVMIWVFFLAFVIFFFGFIPVPECLVVQCSL